MDYHLCSDIGLAVIEADQELSDLAKGLLRELESAASLSVICGRRHSDSTEPNPFFHYTHRLGEPDSAGRSPWTARRTRMRRK